MWEKDHKAKSVYGEGFKGCGVEKGDSGIF